jgi:hypothetical protein
MDTSVTEVMKLFIDHLLPALTPGEVKTYLLLMRECQLAGANSTRIGKRTLISRYGVGSRESTTNYSNISELLASLQRKSCIRIGDTNRDGTLYTVVPPDEIPLVIERIAALAPPPEDEDYFNDAQKRQLIFQRDGWICQYCGERVGNENCTLDHFVPQSAGGKHNKENLRTACLNCNSVKSGRSYADAAPLLLRSIQTRKSRQQ